MERFWADTPTLEQRLIAVGRRPSGFDYLRLGLALCVVGWHSVVTCYGAAAQDALYGDPWRPVVALLLPMFFSLSGFLVAASLERCRTLIGFLGLRVLRIGPALAVETILSAVLLGALTTTLPKADYFASPAFWGYFQNIVGRIHYVLPGVLAHNPLPLILNGQLWTVPFELKGYLALSILSLLTLSRRGRVLLGLTFLACLALLAQAVWTTHALPPAFGPMDGRLLICCFLMGVSLYRLRGRVKFSAALGLAGLAASLILLALPAGDYLATLPVAYATIWLGLQNPSKLGLLRRGDYSYGVFLFGFPIQQAFVSLGPWTRQWWMNLAVCAPLALLVGAISWHAVEKPALGLRPWLLKLEDGALALLRRARALRPAVQACDAVIGANLARARAAARLSPLRLARQMHISVFDLVRTEAGWRMLAPVELCYACRALNLTVAELFNGFDQVELV